MPVAFLKDSSPYLVYNFPMPAYPLHPARSKLLIFIEQALATGLSQESLIGILVARGWPERDIYTALADHYQRTTGVEIPSRPSTGANAKEAFLYLLIFATLATWTIGFGALAFALIERWFADPLFASFNQTMTSYAISSSMAALIVAFPLYLFISRIVARETVADPEKLESPIRKWLTYMALVIAAGVFMGDLITALTYLLRGEFTSRFVAKVFVVLVLSGGVFFYYLSGLRRTDISQAVTPARDRFMALLSTGLVAILLVLGFSQSGAPRHQRELRADAQRIWRIFQIGGQISAYYGSHGAQLPSSLGQLPGPTYADPLTGRPFDYKPTSGSQYQLCAAFDHRNEPNSGLPAGSPWTHPAGYYCITLDPTAGLPTPPYAAD